MNALYGDNIGLTHFISGVAAVLLGGAVLLMKKGTPIHRKVGYLYVASMVVLVISSFGIYRLFGKFGLFHGFSLVAVFSLVMGINGSLKNYAAIAS
ncbi:MAG: hypothetical protein U5L45_11580 [Saprospiraceae bacterium]|nr:hypothetical protein [Saprospiraceae bacterium]